MTAEPSILNAAVTMVFGAIAGGVTNAVAIWMLFHPYTPRGPGRLKLQGAIPKNKARLARTIGRTVGQRLLTPEDLATHLSSPEVQDAFAEAVTHMVRDILTTERGSVRDTLPEPVVREIEKLQQALVPGLADKLAQFSETEEFREAVRRLIDNARSEIDDRPIGDVLTEARRSAIREKVEGWVTSAVTSSELEETIGQWLDRQIVKFSSEQTPLLDQLPPGLVAAVEKAIAGYIPVAIDRLTGVLRDPSARKRIQGALHQLFERFVKDLLIHERLVARLVVTQKTIARMLDNFERAGADDLSRLLDAPEMQAEVARAVNDAVVKFLRRSLSEHIEALGPERVSGIRDAARDHIVKALRDPQTRNFAIHKVDAAVGSLEGKTWGDLLRHIPSEKVAEWIGLAIRSERGRRLVIDGSTVTTSALLDRPIGRPADLLGEGSVERVSTALIPALWDWVQEQVPRIVTRIDVESMVEEKVLGFSLERIEELVRRTTQRELDLIIRLGYVLGAFVGAAAYAVSLLL